MKPEPSDQDEETRARGLAEQCWLGPALLAFWALVIGGCFYGCSAKGAECKLAWNPSPADEQVTSWKVYRGIDLMAIVTAPAAVVSLPADVRSTLSVFAVNAAGTSPAATISVIPFTPKHSEDLRNWTPHPSKVVFIEAKPRIFASYTFPPP